MLLFRSEEEIAAWCEASGRPRGAVLTLAQLQELAVVWYGDRLARSWRLRTLPESQALLASVGLTGDFWRLA